MTELITTTQQPQTHNATTPTPSVFHHLDAFEAAQRMAKALSSSTLVPKDYQGNLGNTLIALEMAQRINASPLAVMQNLHIIHGKPSWSSSFIIAALNSCGRFSPLRFEHTDHSCIAWAYDRSTDDVLKGPEITLEMAKKEGWLNKTGSKWQSMPELMLRYRAAAFFGRLYAPDILMGMHSVDETKDIGVIAEQQVNSEGENLDAQVQSNV